MIEANEIDVLANKLDNSPASGLQKLFADNTADESDLLKDFTKEVDSPFLKDNRRKPTNLKKDNETKEDTNWWGGKKTVKTEQPKPTDEKETANPKPPEPNTDGDEQETFSFNDLEEGDETDDDGEESADKFNKDLINFVLSGLDYGATKGAEMAGYKKKKGSTELKAQKDMVIKYGVEMMRESNFKLKVEHMLLLAMLFYIKASVGQFEKVEENDDLENIKNSHLKVVKSSKPKPRKKEDETEKPVKEVKIKQSIL